MALTPDQRRDRLRVRVDELRGWLHRARLDLEHWTWDGRPLRVGSPWPERTGVRRMEHPEVAAPDGWPAGDRRLALDLGGEGLVRVRYADGSVEAFGLDAEHRSFPLRDGPFAVEAEIVARLPFGAPNRDPRLALARIVDVDVALERLVRRLDLVGEAAEALGDHDAVPGLLEAAAGALRELDWPTATAPYLARQAGTPQQRNVWEAPEGLDPRPPGLDEAARASVAAAGEALDRGLAALAARHPPAGALLLSGHAHLDLAWRWPLSETRLKARRTLSTQAGLLDRHPELHFNQSTAQLYAWLEEDDPELFDRVRAHAATGRLEPIGGMWVEPDCNMPSGESLVRQLLYGQRWFERAFGHRHTVCWLPDCFGFTPALPQLLAGAGIRRFLTIKLSWSETNRFPHDLFWWEGLDGTRVLAHMFDNPDGGYNGLVGPRAALATWRGFRGRDAHPESLLSVGYGDGGGGPTEDMVLRARELDGFPALPAQRFGRVDAFFDRAEASAADAELPVWSGELYLELHRATLTTQGRTKRLHRRAERDLVAAEAIGSVCALAGGEPPASLEDAWRVVLRNEFHDILPGSSIREVYEDAERELGDVVARAAAEIDARLDELAGRLTGHGEGVLVVNPDLSARPLRMTAGGEPLTAPGEVKGLEVAVVRPAQPDEPASASGRTLENGLVRVAVAADGTLASVYDKRAGREVLADRGNQLWAYVDKPRAWDAWDIDATYAQDGDELEPASDIAVVEDGPHRAAIRVVRRFRDSTVTQDVRVWAGSARVDLHTRLDWHDRRRLLKARFPLAIRSPRATFETAFGVVERATHRNTSWDAARFEVPGHRFADLSEPGYGAALLNDGRYGHHALGSELGLSLLRSPIWPDPLADEGEQELTYSLLPHPGGWLEGGVLSEAEDLNRPLLARRVSRGAGASLRPLRVGGLPAGLGTLKPLEDGGGLLLRVYEPQGARGEVTLELPPGWTADATLDLLEEPAGPPAFGLAPFEVRTWRLRRA
jgi:alpha-mannosidase